MMSPGDVFRKRGVNRVILEATQDLRGLVIKAQEFHVNEERKVVREEPRLYWPEESLGLKIGGVLDPHNDRLLVRLVEAVASRDKLFGLENDE